MAQIAAGAAEPQDGLFDAVREQAESVIAWARSGNALAAEHHVLEERGLADAMEMARLLAQAHLDLRALREERRDDVIDSDGDRRVTCEGGRERGRVMIFGDVRTSRIACRKRGKENLHPQDAGLNWGPRCYSAGAERRLAEAIAVMPAERAAAPEPARQDPALRRGVPVHRLWRAHRLARARQHRPDPHAARDHARHHRHRPP